MRVEDDSRIFWSELKSRKKKKIKSMKQNEDKAAGPALWLQSAKDSRDNHSDLGLASRA